MSTKTILYSLTLAALWQCSPRQERIPATPGLSDANNKYVIYQMIPRLFGNTRTVNKPYGGPDENGVGKLEDINDLALKSIRELGTTHIWYTGVIEHATLSDYSSTGIAPLDPDVVVKGRAGSFYAIRDYYDIDPDLAVDLRNRMMEFERLVSRTHEQSMKVIIDFVPNHVAREYQSDAKPESAIDLGVTDDKSKAFDANNNFYYLPGQSFQLPKGNAILDQNLSIKRDGKFDEMPAKTTGNDQFTATPKLEDWFETVKLNYGVDYLDHRKPYFNPVPNTWAKMRDILLFWAGKKVDGFRCDLAQMVPIEFWNWVIPQVKAVNPDIIFIAEIYDPSAYRHYLDFGRFDFLYDKVQLYDTLRMLINGKANSMDVSHIQNSLSGISQNMLHFLENHNEQRVASPFFCGSPWIPLPAMVVSATIDKGPIMIYFGQEVGEPAAGAEGFSGDDGRTTVFDYWGVTEHQKWVNGKKYDGSLLSDEQKVLRKFYADLLNLSATNPAIKSGAYFDLTRTNVDTGNISNQIVSYARVFEAEKLLIVASFSNVQERVKIQLTPEIVGAMKLRIDGNHRGTDLLRIGPSISLSSSFLIETDIPPHGYLILKIE